MIGSHPYYIYAPRWTPNSSGARALHLLCHALNEQGHKAFLVPSEPGFVAHPCLNTPLAFAHIDSWPVFNSAGIDYVAIYPDITQGNPLGAKRIVRWLLAPRGDYGGDATFAPTDKVYGYTQDLADKVLCLPTFDTSVFYDSGAERSGDCFYAHKYDKIFKNKLLPETEGMTRCEGTPEAIADILRRSNTCYIYERTEMQVNALLCGCKIAPVVTPFFNGEFVKEFIRDGQLTDPSGWWQDFEDQLNRFIQDTQQWRG